MEADKKARLIEAGVNLESALQRFMGNEKMVEKYLDRFLTEKSYQELNEALQNNDHESAARAAHTLKSVCGTLGFEKMQNQIIAQENAIRNDRWEEAQGMRPEIENEYQRICTVIKG